jgi:hypothetical protein
MSEGPFLREGPASAASPLRGSLRFLRAPRGNLGRDLAARLGARARRVGNGPLARRGGRQAAVAEEGRVRAALGVVGPNGPADAESESEAKRAFPRTQLTCSGWLTSPRQPPLRSHFGVAFRAKLAARAPRALRLLEPLAAAALGVASGIYIFDPALRAARDERERAAKAASGGSGSGGVGGCGSTGGGSGVGGVDGSGGGGGGGGGGR